MQPLLLGHLADDRADRLVELRLEVGLQVLDLGLGVLLGALELDLLPLDLPLERDTPPVAVVSEAFVAKYFGGRDPIGSRMTPTTDHVRWWWHRWRLRMASPPPTSSHPLFEGAVAAGVVPRLASGPTGRMLTGPEFLKQPLQTTGGPGALVWGPGLLALVLAMVGLYGLVAYSVSQRTTEFGIRIALGAQPSDVAALVLRQGVALMLAGCAIGLVLSLGAARVLAGLFYQIRPFEPIVFAAVLPILVLCGALACYGPARRALRLDPIHALRCE